MTCAFETCDRPVRCNGLCSGHYQQQHAGKPLRPLRGRKPTAFNEQGQRQCSTCLVFKDPDAFYKRGNGMPQNECGECQKKRNVENKRKRQARGIPCGMSGCNNPADLTGLCSTHYLQEWHRKNELRV